MEKIYSFHVRKAVEHINKNYNEELGLEEMASYLGLSKCYFCQLFKKETEKTYSQYVNEVRIERSKYLLINTNLSILEIALLIGYSNQNYYNMVFKRLNGTTPLKYRNEMTQPDGEKASIG